MSSSIFTNTGIVETSWDGRGLITDNFITKNLITLDNGVLFALIRENLYENEHGIYISKDNGFSWTRAWSTTLEANHITTDTAYAGPTNAHGPIMHLAVNEKLKQIKVFISVLALSGSFFRVQVNSLTYNSNYEITESDVSPEIVTTGQQSMIHDISFNEDNIFLTVATSTGLYLRSQSWDATWGAALSTTRYESATYPGNFFDMLATNATNENKVDIIAVEDFGSSYDVFYISYDKLSNSFSGKSRIANIPPNTVGDFNICRDGYGTILCYGGMNNSAGTNVSEYYSISVNNGVTWNGANEIRDTVSQSDLKDPITNQYRSRANAIGCLQGFLLTYTKEYEEKAISYVRKMTTEDIVSYTLGEERIAASHPTYDVNGAKFFAGAGPTLFDLDTVENIRIGYQLKLPGASKSNSAFQAFESNSPVYFGQKLLLDEAYPYDLNAYREIDNALDHQLLCTFNLLGTTYENVDYYAEGLIGNITSKYISAYNRFGTSVDIKRYEPIGNSLRNDKSAYALTSQTYVKAFVDELNYALPAPSGNETFKDFIEKDIRQIHLPPTLHLGRTFLVNNGNYSKRTVWLLTYGGNEYELTQVVPKFIDNQIAYYTANAYVVGPSRDPFSRTILPSET